MSLISDALTRERKRHEQARTPANPDISRKMLDNALRSPSVQAREADQNTRQPNALRSIAFWLGILLAAAAIILLLTTQSPQPLGVFDGLPVSNPSASIPGETTIVRPGRKSTEVMTTGQSITRTPLPESIRTRYRLSGVLCGGRQSVAVVNNTVVTEGQQIDRAVVLAIAADHVILSVDSSEFVLPLSTQEPQNAPAATSSRVLTRSDSS